MAEGPSKKAKVFCWILVITVSVICLVLGFLKMLNYMELKDKCSSEVAGTVLYEGYGLRDVPDSIESKYVSSKYWRKIDVETDNKFKLSIIYDKRGKEREGDNIIIHYDPNDPDTYYIGDNPGDYKAGAIFLFAASGTLVIFMIFIMTMSNRYYKSKRQEEIKYIYFNTPYCKFYFDAHGEIYYEGEVEWNYNLTGEKTCTVVFETDTAAQPPEEGYHALIEKNFVGKEQIDCNISTLVREIPELKAIEPGKCYDRLEKILSDKERTDQEIRKMVADHFLFRPQLIKENSTEQELMDSIELTYIGVFRNGDTLFSIYKSDIYVIDLHVILKADGSKEIHYKTEEQIGTDDVCCDVL